MKHLLVLAGVLAATPVAAQPAIQGERCRVTIARPPDDARAIVEEWVRAEPRCTVTLEIRIVPTDGGLYLLARDEEGRVRERVVPDAQSAGVLVASWVAADSVNPASPYTIRKPELMTSSELIGNEGMQAPGMTPILVTSRRAAGPPRWFTLGGMLAMGRIGGGVRGEVDFRAGDLATLGFAGSVSGSGISLYDGYTGNAGTLDTFDLKAIAYLGATARWSKWHLRTSLGVGAVFSTAVLHLGGTSQTASGLFPTGEASLALGRTVGRGRWAIYGGPVLSLYIQEYEVMSANGYYYQGLDRRDAELMMFFGVRRKL